MSPPQPEPELALKETKPALDGVGDPTRGDIGETLEWAPEEERRILRKIDMTVLPVLCLVCFFQYLDKQSLSYASVFGLLQDLKLTSHEYSWANSIFYFGQFAAEPIVIYLMSRLPLVRFVGASIIIWGAICMCLAAPHNFGGFSAVRFFLGFAEGAVQPAAVTLTSIWYKKREHPQRVGLWVSMNALAQITGSLMMYGIGKNGSISIAAWRVMFLICGGLTIAAGIIFTLVIPFNPETAWFLTEKERGIVKMRMKMDREGGDQTNFSNSQLREALFDPKTWIILLFGFLSTMASFVLTFASLVIKNLGYTSFQTLLYGSPSGAVQFMFIWIAIFGIWLLPGRRSLIIILLTIVPLVGNILLLVLDTSAGWGMIVASWLASSISCIMTVVLSLSASNVKGNTKRAVVNTMYFIGYCVGAMAGPQLWTEPPRYLKALIASIVIWVIFLGLVVLYWLLCYFDNRARDRKAQSESVDPGQEKVDMTDKEDALFRYSY